MPTTILIEWRSKDTPSRVYEVATVEDGGLLVSSPDDSVLVGRWDTLAEVREFITCWMGGQIITEITED